MDDIINSINILAERALNSVEQGLLNAPPQTLGFRPPKASSSSDTISTSSTGSLAEQHKHEVENGTHQLETLLCASIDKNFDLFELYVMRNILCVTPADRDFIRLAHYEGLDFSQRGEEAPTTQGVTALRRRLQASQRLNGILHAEKARNEALLSKLRSVLGAPGDVKAEGTESSSPLSFLQNKGDLAEGDAQTPLSTTTAFTLSQLQAVRALSTSLRNILPDLDASPSIAEDPESDGKKGWRRERAEYVESATRRHLENTRGLELGPDGAVRYGEWQGEGRKLGKGEIEGLEKVVALLGDGSESRKGKDEMNES